MIASPRIRPARPPLLFGSGAGYLSVARRAQLKFLVLPTGRQEVSPAFPMNGANRITIEATVLHLSSPSQFTLGFEGSNDTENWRDPGAPAITFNSLGWKSQAVNNISFRFMRLRYALTFAAGTAAFSSAVWRWTQ